MEVASCQAVACGGVVFQSMWRKTPHYTVIAHAPVKQAIASISDRLISTKKLCYSVMN
jgi:hypothetical protein